jgi:hypothetical protein
MWANSFAVKTGHVRPLPLGIPLTRALTISTDLDCTWKRTTITRNFYGETV